MQKIRDVMTDAGQARRLAAHVWRHFKEDRCFDEAASLTYTSLLSLVPLLAVMFGIASAFETFEVWADRLRNLVLQNLLPASGEQFHQYVERFMGSAGGLTLSGTLFLIVTALLLMVRIERSFNRIWRVPVARSVLNKVTMYWAVLTLGPLALGMATALSAEPLFDFITGELVDSGVLRSLGVFVLTWAAFCLLFVLVPNCHVPLSYAALGALLSTGLFSLAKFAFIAYVSRASFNVIYGALASVPLFLVWLYLVWAVILLGASLAASLTTFSDRRSDWRWPVAWEFLLVFRLLGHLHRAQCEGRALSTEALLELEPGVPSARLQLILVKLMEEKLITQDDEGWVLKRDLDRYSLRDLYLAGEYHLPLGKKLPVPTRSDWDDEFLEVINSRSLDMDLPLGSLYDGRAEAA